jgi:hypothetical protein
MELWRDPVSREATQIYGVPATEAWATDIRRTYESGTLFGKK